MIDVLKYGIFINHYVIVISESEVKFITIRFTF